MARISSAAPNGAASSIEDQQGLLDLPLPRLPGRHQIVNAGTAIAALRQCVPESCHWRPSKRGMVSASWPGRLQNIGRGKLAALAPDGAELWLDGGHNEAGGRVLAEAMADFEDKAPRPLVLLYGGLQTKDAAGFPAPFRRSGGRGLSLCRCRGEQAGRDAGGNRRLWPAGSGCKRMLSAGVEAALRELAARLGASRRAS